MSIEYNSNETFNKQIISFIRNGKQVNYDQREGESQLTLETRPKC